MRQKTNMVKALTLDTKVTKPTHEAGTKAIAQDLDPAKRQGALSMKS